MSEGAVAFCCIMGAVALLFVVGPLLLAWLDDEGKGED